MSSSVALTAKRSPQPIGTNLGAIALAAAMAGLSLAYGIDAAGRALRPVENSRSAHALTRTLGGRDLQIPGSWFRTGGEAETGFAKEIELTIALPLGPDGGARPINVTLLPRSRVRPSASLLDGVYLHAFLPEQLSGPPGLIGKPLRSGEGFENETVWYDALSANPFVAKCLAPLGGDPGRCLRSVYLGPGIAAVYSFGDDVLANWSRFDVEMTAAMKSVGAV